MSTSVKYLEIDSTYRNRNEWPKPSDFEVLISQTGRKGRNDALDPVSDSAILNEWKIHSFNTKGPEPVIYGTFIDLKNTSSTYTTSSLGAQLGPSISELSAEKILIIAFTAPDNKPQTITNYYVGATVSTPNTTPVEKRTIVSSKYIYTSGSDVVMQFEIRTQFGSTLPDGEVIRISDPSDFSDENNPIVFVPKGAQYPLLTSGDNGILNSYLYNETRSYNEGIPTYRKISFYDNIHTHTIRLDTTQTVSYTNTQGPVTSWLETDNVSIRLKTPMIGIDAFGNGITNDVPSSTYISLPTSFSSEQNQYRNSFFRTLFLDTSLCETRIITKYETFSGKAEGGSANTILLPYNASLKDDYYKNMYIQILTGASAGDTRQVQSYFVTDSSKTITVTNPFSSPILSGDQFQFRTIVITPSLSAPVSSGTSFEIQNFSYDNFSPFVYDGGLSTQEMVSYEVELINLVLPNLPLFSNRGGRISSYPYIYVELYNISGASAGNRNIIYSNNPNSTKALFRASIDDVTNPINTSFIKIDGHGMTQTIKFKPNDNLRFTIRLPNGELFQTIREEDYGPLQPNTSIQISALFSLKKL